MNAYLEFYNEFIYIYIYTSAPSNSNKFWLRSYVALALF